MIPRKSPRYVLALTCLLASALGLATSHLAWAASEAVGEVSLAIGVSRVVSGEGRAQPISRAMPVHAGDRIETERGGHIHVRFNDGAYVAVRPGSRLTIESYQYDASRPQDSTIRFRLEQGVVRAVSGKGAEAARERFRLNTPIAAIGVQGTDFVVATEPDRVRVAVHSGAIVLAPLGDNCRADALGPCSTAAARRLSADMGQVMLEFQPQQGAPRVVPLNSVLPPDRLNPTTPQDSSSGAHSAQTTSDPTTEVLAAQAVAQQIPPPPVVQPPAPPTPTTLVWGRWAPGAWTGDTMSLPYAEAVAGRSVTVGNDYYALFRADSSTSTLVSNLGRVDFTLRDAQVHLLRGNVADPGRVDNAWLSVDFAARQFATGVAMSHPAAGSTSLQVSGAVREDGMFAVRNADGRVAGALSLDGREAGYFFERPVTNGTFIGITVAVGASDGLPVAGACPRFGPGCPVLSRSGGIRARRHARPGGARRRRPVAFRTGLGAH
jgi:hypothetical protein